MRKLFVTTIIVITVFCMMAVGCGKKEEKALVEDSIVEEAEDESINTKEVVKEEDTKEEGEFDFNDGYASDSDIKITEEK